MAVVQEAPVENLFGFDDASSDRFVDVTNMFARNIEIKRVIGRALATNIPGLEQTRPLYRPKIFKTLLSDGELNNHGLRVFEDHESSSWIIRLDADNLVDALPSSKWIDSLSARIDELRGLASEEFLPYSPLSAEQALVFAKKVAANVRPSAFLIGNGNVRLMWARNGEQVGLQFQGAEKLVQYVMFARRGNRIARHTGHDDADTILRQITALGLRHILNN